MNRFTSMVVTMLLLQVAMGSVAAPVAPVICLPLPKAQLGQGNNSAVDVSEPVNPMRTPDPFAQSGKRSAAGAASAAADPFAHR